VKAAIITGDRHATWDDWSQTVGAVVRQHGVDLIIHGGARGIDSIADAITPGPKERYPADWSQGKKAGPMRNRAMLQRLIDLQLRRGFEVEVIAFHDDIDSSKGTKNMVRQAQACHIPVTVYRRDGSQS